VKPSPEQESILREEKLGLLATVRRSGGPQVTPVNFFYDGNEVVISITKDRAKYRNIRRNPAVSFCVLRPEGSPYVTVYGSARIEENDIVEGTARLMRLVYERAPPENFADVLREARRVLVFLTPERFVS
jgi:PPOX class probable F420-dependent enzyme